MSSYKSLFNSIIGGTHGDVLSAALRYGRDPSRFLPSFTKRIKTNRGTSVAATHRYPEAGTMVDLKRKKRTSRKRRKLIALGTRRTVRMPRKRLKPSRYGISQMKVEKGAEQGGYNAVYVGGTTHPSYTTFYVFCAAVVRKLFQRANIYYTDVNQNVVDPAGGAISFEIRIRHRSDTNPTTTMGTTLLSFATQQTYEDVIVSVADGIIAQNNSNTSFYSITLSQSGVSTGLSVNTVHMKTGDMKIKIKGIVNTQVQNRTAADAGTDATASTNINHNPLRGRIYTANAHSFHFKEPGQVTTTENVRMYDGVTNESGILLYADRSGVSGGTSVFSPFVEQSLRKPPPPGIFTNCKSSKYVKCDPGEILTFRSARTYVLSFDKWMKIFAPCHEYLATKTLAGMLAKPAPFDYKLGRTHMVGLEKMCDTTVAANNEVLVGVENNLSISAEVLYKPKHSQVPIVQVLTT